MKKFEPTVLTPDELISKYQHVDNGGYSVSVDRYGSVHIEFSFYGYASTKVSMAEVDIAGLIQLLAEAKILLDREKVVEKLKGIK